MARRKSRRGVALLFVIGVAGCHAAPHPVVTPSAPKTGVAHLRRDIDAILASPTLAQSTWGILVKSTRKDDALYSLNAGKLLMPGSTLKILTLATAAERLGWDYTYDTRLVAAGSIDAGVLHGDLVVVGSGDPSIGDQDGAAAAVFTDWADALKARGVRTVTGRIVGDDNVFDDESLGPGWTWDDVPGRDAAGVSGLQYNENVVQATIAPGSAAGEKATVSLTPAGSRLDLDVELTTAAAGSPVSITARRSFGSDRLVLSGVIPLGGEPIVRVLSVNNPTLFFVTAFRDALTARGVEVQGAAVDLDDVSDPRTDGELLAVHHSPPLSTLAMRLMKNSVNMYGDTLLKTIGASAGGPTFEAGRTAVAETLQSWNASPAGVVQVDGSGLSRYNYVTPETLVTALIHADRDAAIRERFEESLPIAGRDGTLSGRMKGTAAEGNARAKTGALANARSLAGYVATADSEPLVFAIIANNFGLTPEAAVSAIDAIVARLAAFRR